MQPFLRAFFSARGQCAEGLGSYQNFQLYRNSGCTDSDQIQKQDFPPTTSELILQSKPHYQSSITIFCLSAMHKILPKQPCEPLKENNAIDIFPTKDKGASTDPHYTSWKSLAYSLYMCCLGDPGPDGCFLFFFPKSLLNSPSFIVLASSSC